MTKLEFLKGRTLITQNDVSFLLNNNKQIQIHYLINDEPNTIQCSIFKIITTMDNEKIYWTMKNGEKIDIDQMTESHLRNTLRLIIKQNQQIQTNCPTNVDMAIDMVERENQEPYYKDGMWK